jgi:hypothetical protein
MIRDKEKKMFRGVLICLIFIFVGCIGRQEMKISKSKEVPLEVQYSGGNGDSHEEAIIITGVKKQSDGLDAEYRYISTKYGVKNQDWHIVGQTIFHEKSKTYDVIEITLKSTSDRRIYYFDVTAFPWKRK